MPNSASIPDSLYYQAVFRSPHSVWLSCVAIIALNMAMFYPSKIWQADLSAIGIHTQPQLVGMLLLFVLVPMWMFACFFVTQRHSLALARQLEAGNTTAQNISADIIKFPGRALASGLVGGLVYALAFNIPATQIDPALRGDWNSVSIILGQIFLWVCIGGLLFVRLHIARIFSSLGKTIEFSLFEQSELQPFARVGMLDVVIVVGSMAIATVQSLDAQFRLDNYLSAMLVATPAAIALLVRPMWALHRRMATRKAELGAEIDALIKSASEKTSLDEMHKLELLLQRRDRVRSLNTWPLDISIWRRLAFYVLIPPLAWVGAALMEVVVSQMLGV